MINTFLIELLSKTTNYIRKDVFILAPYIVYLYIVFLFSSSVENVKEMTFQSMFFNFVFLGWFLQLFFKGLTLSMLIKLRDSAVINLGDSWRLFLSRFNVLLLSTSIVIAPLLMLFYMVLTAGNSIVDGVFFIIILIVIVPLSFVLQFLPVIVLTSTDSAWITVKASFDFVKRTVKPVLWCSLVVLGVSLVSLIFSLGSRLIPVIGTSVVSVLCDGVLSTFICIYLGLFYLSIKEGQLSSFSLDTDEKCDDISTDQIE